MFEREGEEQKPARREASQAGPLSLREAMNQLFDESFWAPFGGIDLADFGDVDIYPEVDISEDENNVVVKANVPGVNSEDINVEVDDDVFTISGKTEKEEKKEEEEVYRYERSYGKFRRRLRLPMSVKRDEASAKVKDGVLTVTLPKTEKEKEGSKSIKVESE